MNTTTIVLLIISVALLLVTILLAYELKYRYVPRSEYEEVRSELSEIRVNNWFGDD